MNSTTATPVPVKVMPVAPVEVPSVETAVQGVNPALVDGTLIVLIVASLTSIGKALASGIGEWFKASQINQQQVLAAEHKEQDAIHNLLQSYVTANQQQTLQLTEAIVQQMANTLERLAQSQASLSEQVDNIAATQERTLLLLDKLEAGLAKLVD